MKRNDPGVEAQTERFWSKVNRRGDDECWPWLGCRNPKGYGQLGPSGREGRSRVAHRAAYERAVGPVPDGMLVLHRCDSPPCCNPSHMFLGTAADNSRDMRMKGRSARGDRNGMRKHPDRVARGERNAMAVLSEADIIEIRSATGRGSQAAMARRFGVSSGATNRIVKRISWAHVGLHPVDIEDERERLGVR